MSNITHVNDQCHITGKRLENITFRVTRTLFREDALCVPDTDKFVYMNESCHTLNGLHHTTGKRLGGITVRGTRKDVRCVLDEF